MELIIEEARVNWTEAPQPERKNFGFFVKKLADGDEGRPSASLGRQAEGFSNPAHFHTEAQFQVLLEGGVNFPAHPLAPIAVHYSDAYTPYGPFLVGRGMLIAVLRQRRAAQFYMSDPQGRKAPEPQRSGVIRTVWRHPLGGAIGGLGRPEPEDFDWQEGPKAPPGGNMAISSGESSAVGAGPLWAVPHPPGGRRPLGRPPPGTLFDGLRLWR